MEAPKFFASRRGLTVPTQRSEDGASYSALSMLHRIAKDAPTEKRASRADLPSLIAAITVLVNHPNTLESIDRCLHMNRSERQCNVDPSHSYIKLILPGDLRSKVIV